MSATKNSTLHSSINSPALAFFEFSSIARGLFLTDQAVKKASIRVLSSQAISSGKHIFLFQGEVANVEESFRAVSDLADGTILRKIFIPGIHPSLQEFLESGWPPSLQSTPKLDESVAILESEHLSAAILAADRALKAAPVQLCKLRLGQGIGGKAYFVISGALEDTEAAAQVGSETLKSLESFVRADLIARPDRDSIPFFAGVAPA